MQRGEILITGGAGFLGSHLADELLSEGYAVRALERVDSVCHFAAAAGAGQSMYELAQYTSVNNLGTAVLLEAGRARGAGAHRMSPRSMRHALRRAGRASRESFMRVAS